MSQITNKDIESLNEEEEATTPEEETPTGETEEETHEEEPVVEEPTEKNEEEEEEKPISRAEKRIRNLANENRELKEQMASFEKQPLPEDISEDNMTTDDLNKIINQRALQAAELLAKSSDVEREYQQQVNDWTKDFDQVKKENPALDPESKEYDPDLDATLARLLDDGQGNPRVDIKVSEVLKVLAKREQLKANEAKDEGREEAQSVLSSQKEEGAITPSSKVSKTKKYTDEELVELQATNNRKYTDLVRKGII